MTSKLDEKVDKYVDDYKAKISQDINVDLMRKVTKGCGPSIYQDDAETVSGSDENEMATVVNSFIMGKLGVTDEAAAKAALDAVVEQYGKSNRNKYRAVVYYMLTKHFGKESIYA